MLLARRLGRLRNVRACVRGTWRALHAKYCKGSASILAPCALSLSPVHGLLLSSSPVLPVLWEAGVLPGAPPAARLARALFHRNEPQEPLRPTRNASLVGAHLTPALAGHCFGLALQGASERQCRAALSKQGVNALARETKVSIARFVRFIELLRDSLAGESPLPTLAGAPEMDENAASEAATGVLAGIGNHPSEAIVPAGFSGAAVLLSFLWSSASDKGCLLTFLRAAAHELPPGAVFAPSASPDCYMWREEWSNSCFQSDDATRAAASAVRAAAAHTPPAEVSYYSNAVERAGALGPPPCSQRRRAPNLAPSHHPQGIELIAFALCSRGSERPEIVQQRFGYRGELPHVPDCTEACLREVTNSP